MYCRQYLLTTNIPNIVGKMTDARVPKSDVQPEHPTLLIPGPIELDDAVLQSMSHYRYVETYRHDTQFSWKII